MTESNRQPTDGGTQRQIMGCFGTFAILPPDLVHSLAFPMHTQDHHRQPHTVDHLVDPNRLQRASYIQCLTLAGTRVPPKPQNQHMQSLVSDDIRGGSISFTSSILKGRSWQAPHSVRPILFPVVSNCTTALTLWSRLIPVSQPEGQPHAQTG